MLYVHNHGFLWHGTLRRVGLLRYAMRWYSTALAQRLADYAYYHQKLWSKITHYLGAALIIFAVLIPLSWLQVGIIDVYEINLMWLVVIVWAISLLFIDVIIALLVAVLLFVIGLVASIFSFYTPNWEGLWVALGALLVGLVLQVIGYFIEGRRAILRDDLAKIFFMPASLISLLLFHLNLRQQLRDNVSSTVDQINQLKRS